MFIWLQEFLTTTAMTYTEKVNNNHFYLGMSDHRIENDWKWVDDTPIDPVVR